MIAINDCFSFSFEKENQKTFGKTPFFAIWYQFEGEGLM